MHSVHDENEITEDGQAVFSKATLMAKKAARGELARIAE